MAMNTPPGGGGYFRQVRIGVCRQGSQTLTLFKGKKSRFDTPFKAQNRRVVQACSIVLIDQIFIVLRFGVDTSI